MRKTSMRDDFSFIVDGKTYKCDRLIAEMISPLVASIHDSDPTADEFIVENLNDEHGDFAKVVEIGMNGEIEISKGNIDFYIDAFSSIGNYDMLSKIEQKIIQVSNGITVNNFLDLLNIQKKCESISEEVIRFSATHFEEINGYFWTANISTSIIYQIITSPWLAINDESSLFCFIKRVIKKEGRSANFLIGAIDLRFLSSSEICKLLRLMSYDDLDGGIWCRIKERLETNLGENIKSNTMNRFNRVLTFSPVAGKQFNGTFDYLNRQCNGNCIEKKIITVEHHNPYPQGNQCKNLVAFESMGTNCYSAFSNSPGGYYIFDFLHRKVRVQEYLMHSRYGSPSNSGAKDRRQPRSWKLMGSNDKETWKLIDNRDDDYSINDNDASSLFKCQNEINSFKFIKLENTGKCHGEGHFFDLAALEFFGDLFEQSNARDLLDIFRNSSPNMIPNPTNRHNLGKLFPNKSGI